MVVTMLETRALSIGYGTREVARGIDITVTPGEVLCLLGPNGAGKTTLFKTLLGLLPPLSGIVTLDGRDIATLARREIAQSIAYVPQAQMMEFAYSVLDLVLMGRTAHLGPFASPAPTDQARALQALEILGIADLAGASCAEISGGQRQLVLIARALAQDAKTIILDEPTASLDLGNRVLVMDRIKGLAHAGLGVVLSTHDPDHALDMAQKVVVIAGHTQAAYGPTRDILTARLLSDVYGVTVDFEHTHTGRSIIRATRRDN
jgi:iron complex transport system ATP-binding protein